MESENENKVIYTTMMFDNLSAIEKQDIEFEWDIWNSD